MKENILYKSNYLWNLGNRLEAIENLSNHLITKLGKELFKDLKPLGLDTSINKERDFMSTVSIILTFYRLPDIRYIPLFCEIWELDPSQRWLKIFFSKNHSAEYFSYESNLARQDFELVISKFIAASKKGFICKNE